jgi:hypothetical protein
VPVTEVEVRARMVGRVAARATAWWQQTIDSSVVAMTPAAAPSHPAGASPAPAWSRRGYLRVLIRGATIRAGCAAGRLRVWVLRDPAARRRERAPAVLFLCSSAPRTGGLSAGLE